MCMQKRILIKNAFPFYLMLILMVFFFVLFRVGVAVFIAIALVWSILAHCSFISCYYCYHSHALCYSLHMFIVTLTLNMHFMCCF